MEKFEYITINTFSDSIKDIEKQEKKKTMLENKGYKLVNQNASCLTYKLDNDIIEYSKTSGEIYIDKNIKSVFENAYNKHPKIFNTERYMYMYSKGDNDYFKNKDTRHYETVRRSL